MASPPPKGPQPTNSSEQEQEASSTASVELLSPAADPSPSPPTGAGVPLLSRSTAVETPQAVRRRRRQVSAERRDGEDFPDDESARTNKSNIGSDFSDKEPTPAQLPQQTKRVVGLAALSPAQLKELFPKVEPQIPAKYFAFGSRTIAGTAGTYRSSNESSLPSDFELAFEEIESVASDYEEEHRRTCRDYMAIALRFLISYLPIITWFPSYIRDYMNVLNDLKAGVTVGVMLIPQGLAYAQLAELDLVYGLYASFIPPLTYTFFGTSRELSVAPSSLPSLLVAAGVSPIYDPITQPAEYVQASIALALMVGILHTLMGWLKLGFIINFLSHSVINGFMSAAAFITLLSQIKHIFGVSTVQSSLAHELIKSLAVNIRNVNWGAVVVSTCCIVILGTWKWLPKKKYTKWFHKYVKPVPATVLVVIFATLASWKLDLAAKYDIKVVGAVPAGVPGLVVPSLRDFKELIGSACTIALLNYMQSMAMAQNFAIKNKYNLDNNQELRASGAVCILGSFFQCYPTAGSLSRTAVNAQSGAKSPIAGFFASMIVLIVLLVATTLIEPLPKAVLGAIILVSIVTLIDVKEPFRLWKISRAESLVTVATFALTAFVGLAIGIVISISLALLAVVWQASRPHYSLEGRLGRTQVFRGVRRFPKAVVPPGMAIFRFDADFFFANANYFENKFRKHCMKPDVQTVILNMTPVNRVDAAAIRVLKNLAGELKEEHKRLLFAGVKGRVQNMLERAGMKSDFGQNVAFFGTVHFAVEAAQNMGMYEQFEREHVMAVPAHADSELAHQERKFENMLHEEATELPWHLVTGEEQVEPASILVKKD
eukprot:m.69804 g.69804  ORF g.69804 m.69804 type:complete len:828 (-) comp12239_c1_seq2:43-2526(-)